MAGSAGKACRGKTPCHGRAAPTEERVRQQRDCQPTVTALTQSAFLLCSHPAVLRDAGSPFPHLKPGRYFLVPRAFMQSWRAYVDGKQRCGAIALVRTGVASPRAWRAVDHLRCCGHALCSAHTAACCCRRTAFGGFTAGRESCFRALCTMSRS